MISATYVLRPTTPFITRPDKSGFTQIELLIAITIIGILVAFLLPVIGMVRGAMFSAKCASLLGQFSVATFTFAKDNRGAIPEHYSKDSLGNQQSYWFGNQAYAQFLEVDTFAANGWPKRLRCPASNISTWFPMGMNGLGIDFSTRNVVWFRSIRSIPTPTETMLIGDANDWNLTPHSNILSGEPANVAPGSLGYMSMMSNRHRGRTNAAYYDGHVASVSQRTLESYTSNDPFWYISPVCQNRPYAP